MNNKIKIKLKINMAETYNVEMRSTRENRDSSSDDQKGRGWLTVDDFVVQK